MRNIRTLNEISPVYKEVLSSDEYLVSAAAESPEAIMVRSASMHDMPLPESLLCVGRAGAGVNNIPLEALGKKGIPVFNTPGANANAVKELAVAALLLASRDVVGGIEWCLSLKGKGADVPALVEKGKNKFVGPEIQGKTLGVIGLGGVGGLFANAGFALGMKVIGYDPYISVDHAWMLSRAIGHAKTLNELLAQSDYLSVHVPLMDETRGMFDTTLIQKIKPGAALLNFSRAELAVNRDVLDALSSGKLRRYVTDFPQDELIGAPGVIAIPHLGASTPESEDNCVRMVARQIDQYLSTGSIVNSVNYPNCDLGPCRGQRMTVLHANVPNMVGSITSLIAGKAINIDNMVNKSRGQFAYTVLDLDDVPDAALIASIAAADNVYRVRVLN